MLPGIESIRIARERILPRIHRTPLLTSRSLDAVHGARVRLKAENLQKAGAFKIRGALNAMLRARSRGEIDQAGVITYSSGNHGQAVALAGMMLGCRVLVVAPEDIASVKRRAIEEYGGAVVTCGRSSEDRKTEALRIAAKTGAHIVPPYDDPDIIAGQGTLAIEILEEVGDLDAILVPVGGGGLISGIAIATKALRPRVRVIGVEPEGANDMQLSLAAGRRITISPPTTIADGLRVVTPGVLTFQAVQSFVDAIWTVGDEAIRSAQRFLLERAKLVVEPSGAVTVAAYRLGGAELRGKSIALVLSGGNLELPAEEVAS